MSTTMRCGNCGREYGLTPEYLAQYGGQNTQCQCGAVIQVPQAGQPVPQQPPMMQYATPAVYQQTAPGAGIWREGNILVMHKGAQLPWACVKCCGQPSQKIYRKKFYWHNPMLALMIIFPGLLIYAIVALIVQKNAEVTVPVCDVHRQKRSTALAISWGMILVGLVGGIALTATFEHPAPIVIGLLVFLAGLIYAIAGTAFIKPTRIDDVYAWFKGVSPEYLDRYVSGSPQQGQPFAQGFPVVQR